MMRRLTVRPALLALTLGLAGLLAGAPAALAQMPDVRQMSGIPRPVDDLPNGSVSIRVIKGDMSHNLANQPVVMTANGTEKTVNTDADGRAQFDRLTPGTVVRFATTVDGERLESQEFPMQPQGGIRMLLVATDPNAAAAPAAPSVPAVAGEVAIAGESRIVVEPSDETVSVYYILDIVNGGQAPVNPSKPFVFTLPSNANGTTVIQGSSPQATNKGREVSVAGPFAPGTTSIQVAAEYTVGGGTVDLAQTFPAPMQQLVVIAKKSGDMKLASALFDKTEDNVIEGTPVVLGMGKGLTAGQTFQLSISGLPHHSTAPRNIALILAGLVIVIGVGAAMSGNDGAAERTDERKRLSARRERLFQDLVKLEHDHRRGKVDGARYSARRTELFEALEQVYGALDEFDGPDPERRAGTAAA